MNIVDLAPIVGWLLLGTLGVVVLCVGAWKLSRHAWRSDDVAPGADVATSLDALHKRRKST